MNMKLIVRVEDMINQAARFGLFTSQELGEIMVDMICPICPHTEGCPVKLGYQMLKDDQKLDKKSLKDILVKAADYLEKEVTKHAEKYIVKGNPESN